MIINIISGKGGTGKTLLCATIADIMGEVGARCVILDMDFAVRGLTALLYYYKGESYDIIGDHRKLSVYDYLAKHDTRLPYLSSDMGIVKYRMFDVIPAVRRIDAITRHDVENQKFDELTKSMRHLLHQLEKTYDYILLDCRAGYDELNDVIYRLSDFTLCVREEDDISYITALNLIKQMESSSNDSPIYNIINKARNIQNIKSIRERSTYSRIDDIGTIPFDMDVMNFFGQNNFWEKIKGTLYYSSVCLLLEKMSEKFQFSEGRLISRIGYINRPLPSNFIDKALGVFKTRDRILLLYGVLFSLGGLLYTFMGRELVYYINAEPERLISLFISLFGITLVVFSILNVRK